MAALLKSAVFFFLCFSDVLQSFALSARFAMYKDLRIRNANRSTPIPPVCKAYVFRANALDNIFYKVIVAPNYAIAYQRLKDWMFENDLSDFFWQNVCEDDFEVAYSNNLLPK